MKLGLKILKLLALLIITVSIILFSASFLLQEKVAGIILKSLNKSISTKLDIGSFKLSFLRKFPNASLELKDVLVHSSTGFNSKLFAGINTDTLLLAKVVTVEFRITDILKGNYNIARIGAKTGKINLYTDIAGHVNYDISVKKESSEGNDLTINLEKIYINNIKASYYNLATKLKIYGVIRNGKLKSRISGSDIDFTAQADMKINRFQLYNTIIKKPVAASLDLILKSSKSGIQFKKGTLRIENFDFDLDGFISSEEMLDLNISGNNIDLSNIRKYLPEKYSKLVADYDPSGILLVKSKIKGLLSRTSNPHIEVNCILKKGHIAYGKSDLTINNLSFAGYFSNGSKNRPETSSVSIKDLRARIGSAEYEGSLSLSGFDNPKTELILKGRVFPGEMKEFFSLKNISSAEGSFDLDLKLVTDFWPKGKLTIIDLLDLKPEVNLTFNSLTLGTNNDSLLFKNLNGNLTFMNIIKVKNFEFIFKGQKIKIDGEFKNLPEWLAGRPVVMIASADVWLSRLIPNLIMKDSSGSEKATRSSSSFSLPDDLQLDINFKIDSLDYKSFSSSNISGILNYKSKLLTFKSLNMESLNGTISGNGFIVQNNIKALIARGSFNVKDIDVNKAFTSFRNFGQDFLKAENIAGTLSGTLSILLPMDSLLNTQIKELTAEGKYQLMNGALINFEPVKQLSKFIELSELENIHFKKLENDFYIRNNFLYIPQMDVKSSAVDLSVTGKHSFNNDYEYHVKVRLSEILSKKRKRNKSSNTEFGEVEDDGLGRTSLLLKIVNKGDDVKVGFDLRAAGNKVINDIKSERQSIKNILNQEYGWYKNDTVAKQKPEEKKPRFRISLDGTDSVKPTLNPPAVKKKSAVKILFNNN